MPTIDSTIHDEIGRRSTRLAAWISGSSETTRRVRKLSHSNSGSSSRLATFSARRKSALAALYSSRNRFSTSMPRATDFKALSDARGSFQSSQIGGESMCDNRLSL